MQVTSNNGNGIRLTREGLATIRDYLIGAEHKYDTLDTFEYLADLGDPFAKMMFDGMNTESYFDLEFFNYLRESTETGERIENEQKFNKIFVDMAKEYINLLEQKLNSANLDEMVLADINSEEVIFIHQKAFAKNEQPLDTWCLYPIFSSLSAHDRQDFWEKRLNSLGDLKSEILHVKKTYLMMTYQYNKANFLQQENIATWLRIHTNIDRYRNVDDEIEERRQELLANDPEINDIDKSIRIMMFGIPRRHYRRDPQQIINNLSVQDRLHDMWFWESAGQIRPPFASPMDWGTRTEAEISQHLTEAYLERPGFTLPNIEVSAISGDINHEEAGIFHEEVFERHGLPKSAWTLAPIFSVMSRNDGEVFWQDILDAAGDPSKEIRLAVRAFGIMNDALIEMPASQQLMIHNWFRRNVSIRNAVDTGVIAAQRVGGMFSQSEINSNMDRINAVVNQTGDPIIDRGSDRMSFWNFPDADNPIQTDWVNRTQQESEQLLTEFYLERPPYIMPDTGLFDVPSINNAPTIESVDRLIDSLSNFEHRTIIMDNSQDMMECRFELPSRSSFDFAGSSFSMP